MGKITRSYKDSIVIENYNNDGDLVNTISDIKFPNKTILRKISSKNIDTIIQFLIDEKSKYISNQELIFINKTLKPKESVFFNLIRVDSIYKTPSKSSFFLEYYNKLSIKPYKRFLSIKVYKENMLIDSLIPPVREELNKVLFFFETDSLKGQESINGILTDKIFIREKDSIKIITNKMKFDKKLSLKEFSPLSGANKTNR